MITDFHIDEAYSPPFAILSFTYLSIRFFSKLLMCLFPSLVLRHFRKVIERTSMVLDLASFVHPILSMLLSYYLQGRPLPRSEHSNIQSCWDPYYLAAACKIICSYIKILTLTCKYISHIVKFHWHSLCIYTLFIQIFG